MLTAAQQLTGTVVNDEWKVLQRLESDPSRTGGHFSTGYFVENTRTGVKGFLKALDFSEALRDSDPARTLQRITAAYNFERDLLSLCGDFRLDRIVTALDSGKTVVENAADLGVVQYLIFELAECDSRRRMQSARQLGIAWRLKALHHIAVGLRQLHERGIAHQDVKPSNVLMFANDLSKLCDLGRAACEGMQPPHENLGVAGDKGYAPPELLYGHVGDWNSRRLGCDTYLLASMIVYFFTGLPLTQLLVSQLSEQHRPGTWGDPYEQVLPFVRDAFNRVIEEFRSNVDEAIRDELNTIVRQLGDPDPALRGHPANRAGKANQYSLERYISRLDFLTKKAESGGFR
jgi:serine/threonine protein kinase